MDGPRLRLLGGFELRCDDAVPPVPLDARRLLAFLSLQERPQQRAHVAGTLWPDVPEDRAAGNLRSALWRVRRIGPEVVDTTGQVLGLSPSVAVDWREALRFARSLTAGGGHGGAVDLDALVLGRPAVAVLAVDLLPDQYEDWLFVWQERWRQLRLAGLEELARRLAMAGRYAEGVDACLVATEAEPLRESAHRRLVETHLAHGNVDEALRQYRLYGNRLRRELDAEPSPLMRRLVAAYLRAPGSALRGRAGGSP